MILGKGKGAYDSKLASMSLGLGKKARTGKYINLGGMFAHHVTFPAPLEQRLQLYMQKYPDTKFALLMRALLDEYLKQFEQVEQTPPEK